jgi:hypothetical protein
MPRAADLPAIPADDEPKATEPAAQEDPGNGFDDLRRSSDPVELPGDLVAQEPAKPEKPADDDLAKMTKAMRDRLARDRRRADRKLAEKEGQFNEVLSAMQAKIERLEKLQASGRGTDSTQDEIATIQDAMTEAMEKGDSKKVTELNTRLVEKMTKRVAHAPDEPEDLEPERPAPPKRRASLVYPKVNDWVDRQGDWWKDPDHAHIRNLISKPGEGLDSKLQAAGYSPHEDAYFVELERILDERFPGVVIKQDVEESNQFTEALDDKPEDSFQIRPKSEVTRQAARSSAPVGGGDGPAIPAGARPRARGSLSLTADEVRTMRTFGLDPRNQKDVKGFIENRGSSVDG